MSEPILSQTQIDAFHCDGFVLVRGLISASMAAQMSEDYDRAIGGGYSIPAWRESLGPDKILQLPNPSQNIPGWRDHVYLQRIIEVGKELLGDDLDYRYDQLIYKPPYNEVELLWHQDAGYHWPGAANYRSTTCWLALSRVTTAMGALQFIPGSHKQGIAEHHDATYKNPIGGALEVMVDASQAVAVEYEPGDATFHHSRTLHYTSGNQTASPRRGLSTHLWPPVEES